MIWVCCLMSLTLMVFPGCVVFDFKEGALQKPDGMVKITNKRIPMDASVMALCFYRPELWSPHTMAEADIYVNRTVIDYRRKNPGSFDYPIGARFVKKKFSKGKNRKIPMRSAPSWSRKRIPARWPIGNFILSGTKTGLSLSPGRLTAGFPAPSVTGVTRVAATSAGNRSLH